MFPDQGGTLLEFEPPGLNFVAADGQERKLITCGPWDGWLAEFLPQFGGWVRLRRTTNDEQFAIHAAIWPSRTIFRLCRPTLDIIPAGPPDWLLKRCVECESPCWKRDIEPRFLPANVIPTCVRCGLTKPPFVRGQRQPSFATRSR